MNRLRHVGGAPILGATLLFIAGTFLLLSFAGEQYDGIALLFMLALMLVTMLEYCLVAWISPHGDRLLIALVGFLTALGMVMQYRISQETALRQLMMTGIGMVAMAIMMLLMRKPALLRFLSLPMALMSLGILGALLFVGKESGGAVNWISIGGILFQPSEFVKVAMILVLASVMADCTAIKELVLPGLFAVAVVMLLVLQRDLGAAMLMAAVFLMMFYAATGRLGATLVGIAACGVGGVASYALFDHVKARISVWKDPWATYSTSGYQIAQGLMAIASGGAFGVGLGMGSPKLIPAYQTDYIFAVICEEFGILFGVGLMAVYLLIITRGLFIALNALRVRERYCALCAFGAAALIAVQTFIIIGGVIKLIPLTGITMPFVSYGGSSMIACMMLTGILEGAAARSGAILEAELCDEAQAEPCAPKEEEA